LHGRADRGRAFVGVRDAPHVDEPDVRVQVLDAADPLVLRPEQREERGPPSVLVGGIQRLRLLRPQQPQMLVRAHLLQVSGHRLAEHRPVQAVVLACREAAPDRGVDVRDLVRKDVPGFDPIQGLSDDLFV
jgi:hypothetical protein